MQKHTEKSIGYLNNHLCGVPTASPNTPLLIENLWHSTRCYSKPQISLQYACCIRCKENSGTTQIYKKI